jgi:RNA polymerase sigma factor (sigma-70 family)
VDRSEPGCTGSQRTSSVTSSERPSAAWRPIDAFPVALSVGSGADQVIDRVDASNLVGAALSSLDARGRDVVLLVGVAELTYEEAAAALDVPVGTVRSRYARSRARLRSSIGASQEMTDEEGGPR